MTLNVGMVISGNTSDAQREVAQLADKTRQFGKATDAANAEASRSFKQLKASIDPVYRAELQLKRRQDLLNKSVREGVITQAEATKIMNQYIASLKAGAASVGQMSRRMSSGVSAHRRMGLAVQNSAYQFADLAVQIDGGVDPMRAVGQQLPQLLGGFGILGSVLGAVVAIAVPLGRALFGTADAVDANIDPLDTLTTSLNEYRAASKDADASTSDLISTYGTASEAVRDLLDLQEELSLRQSKIDLTAAIETLSTAGDVGALITGIKEQIAGIDFADTISIDGRKNLHDLSASYRYLGETLGITELQAKDLIDALDATAAAGTPEEQLSWLTSIREAYLGLVGDVGDLTDEQAAFVQKIKSAELEAQRLVATSGGIAPGIDAAASSASVLALNLSNAFDVASRLSNLQSDLIRRETDSSLQTQYAQDPVALAEAQAAAKFDRRNPIGRGLSPDQMTSRTDRRDRELALARREAARRLEDRGTTSGGGGNATRSESDQVQNLINSLRQEVELLGELDPVEREMIKLRGQLKGATEAETEAARTLIETRNEERQQLESNIAMMDFMRDSFRSFLDVFRRDGDSSLTFLDKLWASLDSIGSKLTDLALNSLTDSLFGKTGTADGGAIGGLFGNLLGGLNLFADGDVFDSPTLFGFGNGQLGVMGEAGREGVVPLEHSFGEGIGVKIGDRETALPLTRLNSGKLGASIQPFATGGAFGGIAPARTPARTTAQQSGSFAADSGAGTGGGVVNNFWSVITDNPKSFAESRATTARAANRLMGSLGRHS